MANIQRSYPRVMGDSHQFLIQLQSERQRLFEINRALQYRIEILHRDLVFVTSEREAYKDHAHRSSEEFQRLLVLKPMPHHHSQHNEDNKHQHHTGRETALKDDETDNRHVTAQPMGVASHEANLHNDMQEKYGEHSSMYHQRDQAPPSNMHIQDRTDNVYDEKKLAEFVDMKRRIQSYTNEIKELRGRLQNVSYSQEDTHKYDSTQDRVRDADRALQKSHDEIRDLQSHIHQLKTDNDKLSRELKILKEALYRERERYRREEEGLKSKLAALNINQRPYSSAKQREIKDLRRKLETYNQDLKETKLELDETKSRLSHLMGKRLTDNNPNIADLSDKNRPLKLAERYNELYDNQWTEAFESLGDGNEQETIEQLKTILYDAMTACKKEAREQIHWLKRAVTLSTSSAEQRVPDVINKQLKDFRKSAAEIAGNNLFEKYIGMLRESGSNVDRVALKVESFTKECFQICWMMSVQDPPVALGPDVRHGDTFNSDMYRVYTQSGPHVDYLVWPALQLYERGELLSKGVAQCYTTGNAA